MFSLMDLIHLSVSFLAVQGLTDFLDAEPNCRFDHDYKVLQKLAELESRLNRRDEDVVERSKCLCNNGWVTFKGKCFLFNDRIELTWDEAMDYCSREDAKLVTIGSQEVDMFLQNFAKQLYKGDSYKGKGMWIGCSDAKNDGLWKWYTDQTLVRSGYSNWRPGQGDSMKESDQNCGVLWGNDAFKWHDHFCSSKTFFICEK